MKMVPIGKNHLCILKQSKTELDHLSRWKQNRTTNVIHCLLKWKIGLLWINQNKNFEKSFYNFQWKLWETSLAVQWLSLHNSNAGVAGLILDWGTEILHAVRQKRKKIMRLIHRNISPFCSHSTHINDAKSS